MKMKENSDFFRKLIMLFSQWLLKEVPLNRDYLSHYKTIEKLVKPGDVILIEGNSRVSGIIRSLTHSPWTHAALCIGKVVDIKNSDTLNLIRTQYKNGSQKTCLLIESEIGAGTIISPLSKYKKYHIRVLRPKGLTSKDAELVINYAANRLGTRYNLRHLCVRDLIMPLTRLFPSIKMTSPGFTSFSID